MTAPAFPLPRGIAIASLSPTTCGATAGGGMWRLPGVVAPRAAAAAAAAAPAWRAVPAASSPARASSTVVSRTESALNELYMKALEPRPPAR